MNIPFCLGSNPALWAEIGRIFRIRSPSGFSFSPPTVENADFIEGDSASFAYATASLWIFVKLELFDLNSYIKKHRLLCYFCESRYYVIS